MTTAHEIMTTAADLGGPVTAAEADPTDRPSSEEPAEGGRDDGEPDAMPPHPEEPAEGDRAESAQDAP